MPKRKKEENQEQTLSDKKVILFDNFIEQRPDFWLQWDQQDQESWNHYCKNFISECWMSLFYLAGGVSAWKFAKRQNQPIFRARLYLLGFGTASFINLVRGYSQTKRDATDYLTKKYLIDESGKETGFWEHNTIKLTHSQPTEPSANQNPKV